MTSKATEDLPLAAPALVDLIHFAKSDGAGGYDSRQNTIAAILALVIDAAPGALDTLNELAAALGDDANFAATVTAALANKQDLDADLTAIAALATAAFGRSLLTLADAAALSAALSFATEAQIRAGTVADKVIAPDQLALAHAAQVLADGANVAWNMASGFNARVTLGGNRTIDTPTNAKEGLTYALEVIQDGTGNRVPVLPAAFKFGSAGAPTFSTGAGKRDLIFLYCYDAVTPEFRASFNKDS